MVIFSAKVRQRPRRRKGSILVLTAFLMVALIGVLAISLEVGALMAERRHAQAVADSSAVAAACDLSYNFGIEGGTDPQGTAKASALATAAASGYLNDGSVSSITVNIPPLSGDYANQAGYAEVLVSYNQARGLSGLYGSGSLLVSARSVARGVWQPEPIGLLALEPALPASLTILAGTRVGIPNASVIVDSISPLSTAIALSGTITTDTLDLSGSGLAIVTGPINANIRTGVSPTPDPLSYIAAPSPGSLPVQRVSPLLIGGTQTLILQPGVYTGGIRVAGGASLILNSGIYYILGGGFTVLGSASVTGLGVTIINAPILSTDAISIAGTGNFTLTPSTSGIFQGFSIIQSPELLNLPLGINPPLTIAGNSLLGGRFLLSGTIYAPASAFNATANGTAQIGAQVICRVATLGGLGAVQIAWDQNTARIPQPVKLVE